MKKQSVFQYITQIYFSLQTKARHSRGWTYSSSLEKEYLSSVTC